MQKKYINFWRYISIGNNSQLWWFITTIKNW